jgi:pyrroline-5-carboxylate reductase
MSLPTEKHPPIGPIAMVGGGQMALALAEGFCRAGLVSASAITVHDPVPAACARLSQRVPGIRFASSSAEAVKGAALVFLAVKPQQAAGAARECAAALDSRATVVSIVAGVPVARLAEWFGTARIIRVMPNTPCLVGKGVSVICRAPEVSASAAASTTALLTAVGSVHDVEEHLLDAVTGLSGSGPGFVALLTEALADGGVKAGLPRGLAQALAIQTVAGTAALIEQTGEHPAQIKDRVASPGGTTIAGLAVLEQRAVRGALIDAVVAAADRARALGRPSDG